MLDLRFLCVFIFSFVFSLYLCLPLHACVFVHSIVCTVARSYSGCITANLSLDFIHARWLDLALAHSPSQSRSHSLSGESCVSVRIHIYEACCCLGCYRCYLMLCVCTYELILYSSNRVAWSHTARCNSGCRLPCKCVQTRTPYMFVWNCFSQHSLNVDSVAFSMAEQQNLFATFHRHIHLQQHMYKAIFISSPVLFYSGAFAINEPRLKYSVGKSFAWKNRATSNPCGNLSLIEVDRDREREGKSKRRKCTPFFSFNIQTLWFV